MAETHVHTKGGRPAAGRWKRALFWAFLGLGVAAFVAAIAATFVAPESAEPWLVGSLVALVVALAGEVVLLVVGGGRVFDEEEEWYDWEGKSEEGAGASRAGTPAATQMVLKCAKCARTFPLVDDGSRPLRATCPHCGRSGLLKEPPAPSAPTPR